MKIKKKKNISHFVIDFNDHFVMKQPSPVKQ